MEKSLDSFKRNDLLTNEGLINNLDIDEDSIDKLINQLTSDVPQQLTDNSLSRNAESNGLKLQDPPNLDEILSTDETLITPTSHNVSIINSACQQVLKEIEHQLLSLLKKNRKEQEIVQGFLNANGKRPYVESTKKSSLKCAGMPYFKDSHGFQPPLNEDVLRKQQNNKLLPIDFIKGFPIWNNSDAKALVSTVKKYDPSGIDWMKISVTDLEGKYSPSECKSKWMMNLNPNINRSRWSSKEIEKLKTISSKYNYQDWDKIAEELGTKRTGLQCCTQYMTHSFPTEGKWTKEEDETLQKLVEKYKVKDYIPWTKVVWHFESRSLKQCQERYAYHLGDIKKGFFTPEEDFVIVYLASKLKNFGEVAKFLPNRVSTQVRARYEYLIELSMPKFSKEEDELLTQLMALYPRNWGKISESFNNRSKVQCRRRWAYLQRRIKLEDDICSEDEESLIASQGNKQSKGQSDLDVENYLKTKKNINYSVKQSDKKHSEMYAKLLDYHKDCHKFLFGPKPRISSNAEDLKKLITKMTLTMKTLSIPNAGPLSGFNINSLSCNCDFDSEDIEVLNELQPSEHDQFEISQKIIPPNFMSLVALRSLTLGWNKIKNLCSFYDEIQPLPPEQSNSNNRILFSDAKKLFKSRLKSIFAFPLLMSNIPPTNSKPVYKPKVRKTVKPLSKRKRKEHAKLMSAAYRDKLKSLNESNANNSSENCLETRKRRRSHTNDNEVTAPFKKRPVRLQETK